MTPGTIRVVFDGDDGAGAGVSAAMQMDQRQEFRLVSGQSSQTFNSGPLAVKITILN